MRKVVSGVLPPSQPSSWPPAVVTMIGKFWRLFGPWRGAVRVVGDPVVAEVDGLSRVAEDAVGGDLRLPTEVSFDGDPDARRCR